MADDNNGDWDLKPKDKSTDMKRDDERPSLLSDLDDDIELIRLTSEPDKQSEPGSGPSLDIRNMSSRNGPLSKGEEWDGRDSLDDDDNDEDNEEELPDVSQSRPGLRYSLMVAGIICAAAIGYLLLSRPTFDKAVPGTGTTISPKTEASIGQPTDTSAPEEGPVTGYVHGGPVEIGIREPSPQEEDILTTEVDPSSTVPGGWSFAPPADQPRASGDGDATSPGQAIATGAVDSTAPAQPSLPENNAAKALIPTAPGEFEGPPDVSLTDTEPADSQLTIIEAIDSETLVVAADPVTPVEEAALKDDSLPLVSELVDNEHTASAEVPQPDQTVGVDTVISPVPEALPEGTEPTKTTLESTPAPEHTPASLPAPGPAPAPTPTSESTPSTTPALAPKPMPAPADIPAPEPKPAPAVTSAPATNPPASQAAVQSTSQIEKTSDPGAGGTNVVSSETVSELWVANLLSTPSQAEADAVWARLQSQMVTGNNLYRYETEVDGTNQHRLRLGFFKDREAAGVAGGDLAKKVGLANTPWLVQPNQSEVNKYNQPILSDLWVVNISSSPDKAESDSVWEALNQESAQGVLKQIQAGHAGGVKGLSLYRSETQIDNKTQYRIRLGFFDSATQAEEAGRELARAASLGQSRIGLPWAVRPNQGEVNTNQNMAAD